MLRALPRSCFRRSGLGLGLWLVNPPAPVAAELQAFDSAASASEHSAAQPPKPPGQWHDFAAGPRAYIRGRTLSHWQRKIELQKWAVLGGRFGQPSGICWGLDGDGPRFRPPEGSFVNFFAKMANTVLRSRRAKRCATAQPAPAARIALSTRQGGLVRPMMVWAHDLRCIPTSLANKIPVASNSRGSYCRAKTCATAVTTSPIDSPFDRSSRLATGPGLACPACPEGRLQLQLYHCRVVVRGAGVSANVRTAR
eukprot:COSAG04_NODE_220_length_19788_cov_11.583575_4_plen_253_part_00